MRICLEKLNAFPVYAAVYAKTRSHLTERQSEVLEFIRRYLAERGFPPSVRNICDWFGWRSTNAAEDHLRALERKGAIRLSPGVARGIRIL